MKSQKTRKIKMAVLQLFQKSKTFKRFRRWYLRKFFNIYITVKPSGTVSQLTAHSSGIEPLYNGGLYERTITRRPLS